MWSQYKCPFGSENELFSATILTLNMKIVNIFQDLTFQSVFQLKPAFRNSQFIIILKFYAMEENNTSHIILKFTVAVNMHMFPYGYIYISKFILEHN